MTPPPVCVFTNEEQVTKFQDEAGFDVQTIGYDDVVLQPEAMKKLKKAREEAQKEGLDITPRDGAEAARRNYDDSVRLWNSRFEPALDYWLAQGRLTQEEVTRLRGFRCHNRLPKFWSSRKPEFTSVRIFQSRFFIRLRRRERRNISRCWRLMSMSLRIHECARSWLNMVGFKPC